MEFKQGIIKACEYADVPHFESSCATNVQMLIETTDGMKYDCLWSLKPSELFGVGDKVSILIKNDGILGHIRFDGR